MAVKTTVESGKELEPPTVNLGDLAKKENALWWMLPKPTKKTTEDDKPHNAIIALVKQLRQDQMARYHKIKRHMRLYGGRNFNSLDATGYQKENIKDDQAVAFNGIQSSVDTIMSKIAKNKPVPTFLTEGGNFEDRIKAKKLSRYVQGVFHDQKVYEKSRFVTKGALVLGDGAFYAFEQDDRVKIEWVFTAEILVDDVEAFYGKPGNFYREKHIPRHALLAQFPEHETAILAANTSSEFTAQDSQLDHVFVVEAWHLASKPGAKDGRHVIAIDKETLADDVYIHDVDPFVWLKWEEPLIGFHSRGVPEELLGLQVEVNRLLRKIQASFHLAAVPWVLAPQNANLSTADFRNEIGLVLRYMGNVPPKIQTHQTVHPEIFTHLERLVRMMFEKVGVSQLSASSKKPAGLESGIALREFHNIETERFILFGQAHENAHLELARRIVNISREIAARTPAKEGKGKLKVRSPGRRDFLNISWDDVDLDDERYVMQVFPISSLPSSPAGRKDEIIELLTIGMIDMPVAMQLLDFPDLSAEKNIQLAALENIDWITAEMLEEGNYHPPQPFQDLALGIARVNSVYLMAMTDGAPEKKLALLRRWMTAAEQLINSTNQPAPAAPAIGPDGQAAPPPPLPPPGPPIQTPPLALPPEVAGGQP